jgi:hypothetical protein
MPRVTHAQAQARKAVLASESADGIPQPIIAPMSAPKFELGHPEGQIKLVVEERNVLEGNAIKLCHRQNGATGRIVKGLGNEEPEIFPSDGGAAEAAEEFFLCL